MQKGQTLILILLGILVVAVVAGGAYYLGRQTATKPQLQNSVVTSQIPQPTLSQASSTDETVTWKTYSSKEYGFAFKHPNLDDSCCGIAKPVGGNPKEIVVLADPATVITRTDAPFDGFAVFVDLNTQKLSFNDYVSYQKQAWLEWEKITVGPKPIEEKTESPIVINNRQGVILKGYASLADTIYVPFPDNQKILVIVKQQVTESFSKKFNQVLATFIFQ